MSCCHNGQIPLDPYEIARLARNRKISTTEFIDRFLVEGGIVISNNKENHACAFLGDGVCNVYEDRPLLCRTYPLYRSVRSGREEFIKLIPLPETKGEYGETGTTRDFLKVHDTDALVEADDKYFALANRIIEVLGGIIRSAPASFRMVRETMTLHYELRAQNVPELIDVDRVVADYCQDRGFEPPTNLDGIIALHIEAIEHRLAALMDDREILQMAALAGALGIATGARVKPLLAAQVVGRPPMTAMSVANQKVSRE
jgi:Fe-S-cluster containining protein